MNTIKHTGHVKTEYKRGNLTVKTEYVPKDCKACEEKRIQELVTTELEQRASIKRATQLECDSCKSFIGWVDANDLEGSNFYCSNCHLIV